MAATPTYVVKRIGDQYVTELKAAGTPASACTAYTAGGVLVAAYGLFRGGLIGLVLSAFGVGLAWRGLTGHSPFCRIRGGLKPAPRAGRASLAPSYQNDRGGRAPQLPADEVDEASMESFPASDPPALRHTT